MIKTWKEWKEWVRKLDKGSEKLTDDYFSVKQKKCDICKKREAVIFLKTEKQKRLSLCGKCFEKEIKKGEVK